MAFAKAKVKQSLALMLLEIIRIAPSSLENLSLQEAKFDELQNEMIWNALAKQSSLTSLKKISLSNNARWFNSLAKCQAWAEVFQK